MIIGTVDDGKNRHRITERALRNKLHQLKRVLGEKALEVDFFKGALQKIEARRQSSSRLWRDGVYDQIRELMPMQGSLSIERMCHLAEVSRAGFYRSLQEREPVEEDMEVRSAIQRIVLEHRRRYGYRRVTAELRRRGCWSITNGLHASCGKTICLRCNLRHLWRPPIPIMSWRFT